MTNHLGHAVGHPAHVHLLRVEVVDLRDFPLARQAALDDAFGKRVRVTEICPGRVATDIFAHVHGDTPEVRARFIEGFELPEAKDIADAIAFAIAAPVAVNIGYMEITPTLQVMGGLQTAKPEQPAVPAARTRR